MQKLYGIPVRSNFRLQELSTYKGNLTGLGTTGLIVIAEPDRSTCMTCLNEIMCVASLTGLPMQAVSEPDMGEVEVTGRGEIRSLAYPVSLTRQRFAGIEFEGTDEATLGLFREVPPQRMVEIMKAAERAIDTKVKSDCAVLCIQAGTLAGAAQYTQSFLSSWSALETHYRETFRILASGNRKPGEKARAKVGVILKTLRSKSLIGDEEFSRVEGLRVERNRISHENRTASREEALECYKECAATVRDDLGITTPG